MAFKLIKTFKMLQLFILFTITLVEAYPPIPEKLELHDSGTFVISTDDEDYIDNENEFIQPEHLEQMTGLANGEKSNMPLHIFVAQSKQQISRDTNDETNRVLKKDVKVESIVQSKKVRTRFKREDTAVNEDEYVEAEVPTGNSYDSAELQVVSTTNSPPKLGVTKKLNNDYDQSYPESTKSTSYDEITEETTTSEKETLEFIRTPEGEKEDASATPTLETLFESSTTVNRKEFPYTVTLNATEKSTFVSRKATTTPYETDQTTLTGTTATRKASTTSDEWDQTVVTGTTAARKAATTDKTDQITGVIATKNTVTIPAKKGQTEITTATTKVLEFEKILPEYSFEFENSLPESFAFNFTDDEVDKSLKKIIKNRFKFKKVQNCSDFHGWSYGIQAFGCAMYNLAHAKSHKDLPKLFLNLWKIIRVWLVVYICLAIPCWCHKGWCCCCFRCKLCFPRRVIKKEKKYYVKNPPGVLVDLNDKKKEPVKYEASLFEKDAYEKFENTLRRI